MQSNRLVCFFVLFSMSFFSGCNRSYTHEYLLQHPKILEKELARCEAQNGNTVYCDSVKETVSEFMAMANLRRDDAEGFGHQILQTEIDLSNTKQKLQQAQQAYEKSHTTVDQDKLKQLQLACDALVKKINVLLAVVAGTSPDEL